MAEKMYEDSKKLARKLQALYHPDVNPGNEVAQDMFLRVGRAIKSLGLHTQEMRAKYEERKDLEPTKERVHFK